MEVVGTGPKKKAATETRKQMHRVKVPYGEHVKEGMKEVQEQFWLLEEVSEKSERNEAYSLDCCLLPVSTCLSGCSRLEAVHCREAHRPHVRCPHPCLFTTSETSAQNPAVPSGE